MSSCSPCATPNDSALDADELAQLCKALGHPARVKLLKHLIDYGACFFGDLSEVTGLAASTTSQHVSILKDAGLICGSSDVNRVCYCINETRLARLKQVVGAL
jgi:ArsR family transcriptional regulator